MTAENERLRQDPQFQLTPRAMRRFERTLQWALTKRALLQTAKGVYKVINKVAMVIFVLLIVFSAAMFGSAEFHGMIYKLVFT
jgi:hypothetical protein